MADDLSQVGADPFASFDRPEPAAPDPSPPQPDTTNYGPDPFAQFDPENQPVETGAAGAFMHHAEAGVLPSLTGMAGAGMGAPIGAEIGAAGGFAIAGPPGAIVGAPLGAFAGGITGFMGGSQVMTATQDWLLKQMPESWQELLGQSEKQRGAEERQQPIASQIGELAPFVITMRPSIIGATTPIPVDASKLQRLWASPMTSHVLSAAMQGGSEAVSEVASGQKVDPSRIAIATAFGLMFDKPTKLGERLSALGERPIQMITGRGEPTRAAEAARAAPVEPERLPPTIAEAADAQVLGPGITEGVFLGSEKQDPALRAEQQTAAQIEADAILPAAAPDPTQTARTMEPELFAHYDDLVAQRDDLAARHQQASEFVNAGLGNVGEVEALQKHIAATDAELRSLAPEIAAAHRRAADVVQSETVEPETVPNEQNVQNGGTPEKQSAASINPERVQAQAAAIAEDVTRQLIAAGRPEDEAGHVGQLLSHRYVTRAARLGNTVSPEVLYQSEGATIRAGGRQTAEPAGREMAQRPALDVNPSSYKGPRQAAVRIGGKVFTAKVEAPNVATHSDAVAMAVEHFGVDSPEIKAFEENPESAFGMIAGAKGKASSGRPYGKGFTSTGISGDGGKAAVARVETAREAEPREDPRILEQFKRGAITFVEGRKPVIKLFKDADASTAIHETGHQWLEELMRDSVHPSASDVLKDDAQTVRDWLGIKDIGDPIKTAQHEKFARSFEQYLREGVAPSPGLARVFAQFKTWLTQIYQSIKGLGTPINDDIKQVFDRMLAEEPNRTVIAPEAAERGQTLHDIHETEAEDVTPEQAGPAADRISAERDDYLARQPAEIRNELETAIAQQETERAAAGGTEPAGETGARAEPGATVGDAGGEPVAQPAGGAGGGQPRPEFSGGGEGIPEGVNGPELRSNGPGIAGDARSLPPEPAPAINRTPKFVDKAGNVRLDNINSTDDIKQVLRDFAEQNNDFIDYRRGKVSKGQILDLAHAIGETDPDFLMRRRIGQSFNAEEIKYAEKLLAQSAQSLAVMMKPGAGATPEEVRAYAEARSRHKMIQAQFSGLTAETGRAFAALKKTQSFWSPEALAADKAAREATGRTLNQLQQEMALGAELDTPEKVSRFLRDQDKKNAVDGVLEFWISALLSGTKTWLVNDASNFITAVNHFGPDVAAAALAGRVRTALGREGPRVHASEIGVAAKAAVSKGIPIGVKAMLDSFKAGRGVELPQQSETPALPFVEAAPDLHAGPALDEGATYRDLIPEVYGLVKGTVDAAISNGKLLAAGGVAGSPLVSLRDTATGVIPNIALRGVTIPVGDTVRLPLRNLSAHDSFFRAANFTIEKARTAYRTALEEGLRPGSPEFDRRVAQVSDSFTPDQMTTASDVAQELTFMGRRGPFTSALVRLANSRPFNMPLPKFIVPFVSTPLAIIESAVVHRTPLAFLAPEVRADLMGANGNIAQDMAVGRLLMGTLYGVAGAGLASMGLLSGSGPQNSNDAAAWRMAGNQAHSVRVGDLWYQINQLGPLGLWLSMVADGHDVAGAVAQGDWGAVFGGIQQAFAQNIVDMSSLTGVSDLMQAIQDPDRYGTSYVSKFLSSFVPAIVAQAAKSTDPYQRQAQGILESAQARIPFSSQGLPVRRDIWGDPLPQNMPAFGMIYSAKVQTDPLNRAFMDGGYWPGYPKKTIRGVKLTETQFDEYSMVAGRLLRQNLTPAVMSSQWSVLPAAKKHDVLSKAVKMSRESARNYMLAKFPNIGIQATRAKQGLDD